MKSLEERLLSYCLNNKVSHAYILEGIDQKKKLEIVNGFLKRLLIEGINSEAKIDHGNHEDIFYVEAEGNSVKDESIEELQSRIRKKPSGGGRNIVIVKDADKMTLRAQNRLLKTLEEPIGDTVLILLSENIQHLTETIRSRCTILRASGEELTFDQEWMEFALEVEDRILSGHSFSEIAERINGRVSEKNHAYIFLDCLEKWYRDILMYDFIGIQRNHFSDDLSHVLREKTILYKREKIYSIINSIEEARLDLNRNINTIYALKKCILKIGG